MNFCHRADLRALRSRRTKSEEEREEMQREKMLHGSEIFTGGKREKSIESVLPPEK